MASPGPGRLGWEAAPVSVPGVRYVLAPAATGVLLAFKAGALLARGRETSARSE